MKPQDSFKNYQTWWQQTPIGRKSHNISSLKYYYSHKTQIKKYANQPKVKQNHKLASFKYSRSQKGLQKLQEYYQNNKAKIKKKMQQYYQTPRGKLMVYRHVLIRRNIFKKIKNHHTLEEWQNLLKQSNGVCKGYNRPPHYVGFTNLTKDHIAPIAISLDDSINNIQTLCRSCNTKKGRKVD